MIIDVLISPGVAFFILGLIFLYLFMDALIVYPENKEQLTALKAVMKAMKIAFEQKSEVYPNHVTEGIKASVKESEEGKITPYVNLRDMLDLA